MGENVRKETVEDSAYKQLLQGILLYLDIRKIFDIAFLESYFCVYICKCLNFLTIYFFGFRFKKFEKKWSWNKKMQGTFREEVEDIGHVTCVGTGERFRELGFRNVIRMKEV